MRRPVTISLLAALVSTFLPFMSVRAEEWNKVTCEQYDIPSNGAFSAIGMYRKQYFRWPTNSSNSPDYSNYEAQGFKRLYEKSEIQ